MSRHNVRFALLMMLFTVANALAQMSEDEKLNKIFHEEWEWGLRENPFFATFVGDPRYADEIPNRSLAAIEWRRQHSYAVKAKLDSIDHEKLSEPNKLNYDLFTLNVAADIEGQKFRDEFMPINQMGGIHSGIANLAQIAPKLSVKNVEDLIARLNKIPTLIDQTIVLMQEGLEQGITPPKVTLREVAELMEAQIVDDPTKSPIYHEAFANLPSTIPANEQTRLKQQGRNAIANAIIPAFRKLHDFWVNKYYPNTRATIALSSLPNGYEWYNYNVKVRTTTELTANEIHEIGLSEVKRIRAKMEDVKNETGFQGNLHEFFEFLRSAPQFFFTEENELLTAYRDIAKRIDPELPKLFGKLPRLPYGVIPVPEYDAKTQTTAYYRSGSPEAGRAGYFFANTYDLASRPKWEMEALTVHEAVPGHHLQIALAQELEDVPRFRKFGGYTAFTEGWGLYSESLGEELGLYKDPYSKFGQLTYEMWRAIRLVVDTGMHAKGWPRQQAIDFFKENAGKAEHDIVVEIDRYIVWPGQALAYKIGELKIKELRMRAEQALGDQFDLRAFHDVILGAGALPLSILDKRLQHWIAEKKS